MSRSKVEKLEFFSNKLGKNMAISIYLPEDYNSLNPFPVLYFFHGRSGDENIIFDVGMKEKADSMIRSGEIEPIIIVCPRIENSRGINSSAICKEIIESEYSNRIINLGMYEDYFIKEVVPLVDNTFNTIKDRSGRYIGGASAGGYIALHNALRHQNMFSKVGGHMPAIELDLEDDDKIYYTKDDMWEKYNPIHIAQNNDILQDIQFYLDAGENDEGGFYEGCLILHNILREKGLKSKNHVFKGHHNIEYIKSNVEKYLKFYGR